MIPVVLTGLSTTFNDNVFELEPAFDPSVLEYVCDTRSFDNNVSKMKFSLSIDPNEPTRFGCIKPSVSSTNYTIAEIKYNLVTGRSEYDWLTWDEGYGDDFSTTDFTVYFGNQSASVSSAVVSIYVSYGDKVTTYQVTVRRNVA